MHTTPLVLVDDVGTITSGQADWPIDKCVRHAYHRGGALFPQELMWARVLGVLAVLQ